MLLAPLLHRIAASCMFYLLHELNLRVASWKSLEHLEVPHFALAPSSPCLLAARHLINSSPLQVLLLSFSFAGCDREQCQLQPTLTFVFLRKYHPVSLVASGA